MNKTTTTGHQATILLVEDLDRRPGEDVNDWFVRVKRQSLNLTGEQLGLEDKINLIHRIMRNLEEAVQSRAKRAETDAAP